MLFIDIAVPRDIEEQVSDLRDAYLYSVDDLHGIIEENKQARQEAAIEAEQIIQACSVDFCFWLESLKAVESIRNYRSNSEMSRDKLLNKALGCLEKGDDAQKVLQEFAFKLTNKLIHHPSQALALVGRSGDDNELQILRSALGLNEE